MWTAENTLHSLGVTNQLPIPLTSLILGMSENRGNVDSKHKKKRKFNGDVKIITDNNDHSAFTK
jgi:hypothetical protein